MYERKLETEQNCSILTHSIGHNRVSFPFSWAAQPDAWGPSLSGTCSSIQYLLSNSSDPQLLNRGLRAPSAGCWLSLPHFVTNWLNFLCTELYNSSTHIFLWASQIALIQPIHGQCYTLLFLDRTHLLFIQVHFLFWQPGRVVGQYTTQWLICHKTQTNQPTRSLYILHCYRCGVSEFS